MKKALAMIAAAALAPSAWCATSYMASQAWVTNRINTQVFASDRFRNMERAFTEWLPSLDDGYVFEDDRGTNAAYYVYQYGGYPIEGHFLVWNGADSNPTVYTNAEFGVAYNVETNYHAISFYTNVMQATEYEYESQESYDVYEITNRFYDTSVNMTPVYGTNETIYLVYTNLIVGVECVVTNEFSQTPLLGYDVEVVTNGYEDVITVATNYTYGTSITTNVVDLSAVDVTTNTYTRTWMSGRLSLHMAGVYGQQFLYDSTGVVMRLLYYPCSDLKRDEALSEVR